MNYKQLRKTSGYHPGKTPVEYEPPKLHRIAQLPTYKKHTRTIRSWNPKTRKIETCEVEKIVMCADGKTPRTLIIVPTDIEGIIQHVPQLELVPVQAPVRLKKDSPKARYRAAKKAA